MAGLLHRTAQPLTLAAFRPWEGSAGAGRVRPAGAKIGHPFQRMKLERSSVAPISSSARAPNGRKYNSNRY